MCRITGFRLFGSPLTDAIGSLTTMRDTMTHGGPDDAGLFIDLNGQLGLGHRRLSILDLSPLGHQPMQNDRYVLCYNGEIYNHIEIRKMLELSGHTFYSQSDTEVVLAAFLEWGEACVDYFRGMFAFALWDKQTHVLRLCRDRVGVKPLYWYYAQGRFLFGSELKSLCAHPHFIKKINQVAVSHYLKVGYIPDPLTIYQNCHKLSPGSWLTLDAEGEISQLTYWSADWAYASATPVSLSPQDIQDQTESRLRESFNLRMVSDVPVGVFLSSGVDSSLVAALLSQTHSLKTFTIGFEDTAYNEAEGARHIAAYLGAEHTEYTCNEADFLEVIPLLPILYDEPFGDSSAIPTYLVSRLAKSKVSVSLSADGGDELFGGYVKYESALKFYPPLSAIPLGVRKGIQQGLSLLNPEWIEKIGTHIPRINRFVNLKDKFSKFRQAMTAPSIGAFFQYSGEYISDAQLAQLKPGGYTSFYDQKLNFKPGYGFSYFGLWDLHTYLPGDILTKVDRATMGVALEGREPFLDHHLIEWAMQLSDTSKWAPGQTKRILRDILSKYLPPALLCHQKKGFGIPVYQWLRGALKGQLQAMAHDTHFCEIFGFSPATLQTWVNGFLDNRNAVSAHCIWFLFQLWQWKNMWLNDLN